MRPIARVRLSTGSRATAGASGANATALRTRFEQLLQGGSGLPAVTQTESSRDAPSSTSARSAGLDVLMACPEVTMTTKEAAAAARHVESPALTIEPLEAIDRSAAQRLHGVARPEPVQGVARQNDALPSFSFAATAVTLTPATLPLALTSPTAAAVPSPTNADALQPEPVVEAASTARKPDSSDAQVTPPELRAPDRSAAHLQSNQQPSTLQHTTSGKGQKDLPELVRELVQAVVYLARGREGQWRLTMALKPQVLEGTVVELSAQPGSLQVRFDCAGPQACARLTAARTDLHQRLTEALSTVRPVDVRVDVQTTTQEHAHGHA